MVYRSTAYSLLNLMMFGARALDTLCRDQGVCYCRADGTEENGREGGCNCPSRIWQISMMQNLFNQMTFYYCSSPAPFRFADLTPSLY